MVDIKYAVYPGTVTLYNGDTATFNALQLATAYGVEGESYFEVTSTANIPSDESYLEYIHLRPRADNIYRNIKETAQDDDENITYGDDFDGSKNYIQETDRKNIAKDYDLEHN